MSAYQSEEPTPATSCIDSNCLLASTIFTLLDVEASQSPAGQLFADLFLCGPCSALAQKLPWYVLV